MFGNRSHSMNVMESPFATVTSGGHWFRATSKTVENYVPGLLEKYSFETLVLKAVTWIDSSDSIAMLLYFILAYSANQWIAIFTAPLFHFWFYKNKSAFVNIYATSILKFLNNDFIQLLVAAVALSFMGIWGMYNVLIFGIIYFFLFKIGLLRRVWEKLEVKSENVITLNDRVLKMVLIRYSLHENIPPSEIDKMDRELQEAATKSRKKHS